MNWKEGKWPWLSGLRRWLRQHAGMHGCVCVCPAATVSNDLCVIVLTCGCRIEFEAGEGAVAVKAAKVAWAARMPDFMAV